jgi:hypothetical protein
MERNKSEEGEKEGKRSGFKETSEEERGKAGRKEQREVRK